MPNPIPCPKFAPKQIKQIKQFCMLGATQKELADLLGIDFGTFKKWCVESKQLDRAIRSGTREANAEVAARLYDRAVGMTVVEEKAVVLRAQGEPDRIEVVPLKREIPPDVSAAAKILHNKEAAWRDNTDAFDKTLDVVQLLTEAVRRFGEVVAKELASRHGYTITVVNGEAKEIKPIRKRIGHRDLENED